MAGLCALLVVFCFLPGLEIRAEPGCDVFALMEEVRRLEAVPFWPGFDPQAIPVALFDDQNTYLFNFPYPLKGFRPVEDRSGVFVFEGWHPSVLGNRRIQIDGVWVATSVPRSYSPDTGRTYTISEMAGIVIHEKFHVFQALHHPDWRPNDALLLDYPLDTPESLALRRMEIEAVKRALLALKDRDAAGWARSALDIRRERLAVLSEKYAVYEREVQRLEGIAEYIEYRACGRGIFDAPVINGFAPIAAREMGYFGGRWIATLLDRMDPGWKARMEAGEFAYLEEELENILPSSLEPNGFSPDELRQIREEAGEAMRKKDEERKRLARNFQMKLGTSVEFVAKSDPLRLEMIDPFSMEAVSERRMIHRRWLILKNDDGVVEVINRPCLTELNDRSQIVRLVITGMSRRKPVVQWLENAVITQEGVTAVFKGVKVSSRGDWITIYLR